MAFIIILNALIPQELIKVSLYKLSSLELNPWKSWEYLKSLIFIDFLSYQTFKENFAAEHTISFTAL